MLLLPWANLLVCGLCEEIYTSFQFYGYILTGGGGIVVAFVALFGLLKQLALGQFKICTVHDGVGEKKV